METTQHIPADLMDDVLAAIYEARHRLWREYSSAE